MVPFAPLWKDHLDIDKTLPVIWPIIVPIKGPLPYKHTPPLTSALHICSGAHVHLMLILKSDWPFVITLLLIFFKVLFLKNILKKYIFKKIIFNNNISKQFKNTKII
jgi:hypothetical protein